MSVHDITITLRVTVDDDDVAQLPEIGTRTWAVGLVDHRLEQVMRDSRITRVVPGAPSEARRLTVRTFELTPGDLTLWEGRPLVVDRVFAKNGRGYECRFLDDAGQVNAGFFPAGQLWDVTR